MPRCNDSETGHGKHEDLLRTIRRYMPYQHQLMYEWPYMAGATCLVVLLIWQPFQPPTLAVMFSRSQPGAQAMQRSLKEIDANCYQVRSKTLIDPLCQGCDKEEQATARPGSFEFGRSTLTCLDIRRDASHESGTDIPANMLIEVIRSNHSF